MNVDTKFTNPEIIALDFYDGATEGFALSVKKYEKCYFKMIAWDSNQDKRLYVIKNIDASVYDELVRILMRNQESSSAPVWMPEWKFKNDIDKQKANNISDICQKSLLSSQVLVLGESINDETSEVLEINDEIISEVRKVLERNEPDDLSSWLLKLKAQ